MSDRAIFLTLPMRSPREECESLRGWGFLPVPGPIGGIACWIMPYRDTCLDLLALRALEIAEDIDFCDVVLIEESCGASLLLNDQMTLDVIMEFLDPRQNR